VACRARKNAIPCRPYGTELALVRVYAVCDVAHSRVRALHVKRLSSQPQHGGDP
jgi:hypothetical protein